MECPYCHENFDGSFTTHARSASHRRKVARQNTKLEYPKSTSKVGQMAKCSTCGRSYTVGFKGEHNRVQHPSASYLRKAHRSRK